MNISVIHLLDDNQIVKLNDWKKQFKEPSTAIGGAYTYMFTPTGMGLIIKVQNWKGDEIDLTDSENW